MNKQVLEELIQFCEKKQLTTPKEKVTQADTNLNSGKLFLCVLSSIRTNRP